MKITAPVNTVVLEAIGTGQHSLVVVEDPLISNLVRSVLQRQDYSEDYSVVMAAAAEAITLLRRSHPFKGILVTNTPGFFVEFVDTLRLLYLSSAPDPELEAQFRHCRVVRKPFAPAELVQAVKDLTGIASLAPRYN